MRPTRCRHLRRTLRRRACSRLVLALERELAVGSWAHFLLVCAWRGYDPGARCESAAADVLQLSDLRRRRVRWCRTRFTTWNRFRPGRRPTASVVPIRRALIALHRPISQLGAIDQFESAASSVYNGMTVSLRKRMSGGMYFNLAYTWAHAIDSGQDALVAGQPATVQNSYSTERASAGRV